MLHGTTGLDKRLVVMSGWQDWGWQDSDGKAGAGIPLTKEIKAGRPTGAGMAGTAKGSSRPHTERTPGSPLTKGITAGLGRMKKGKGRRRKGKGSSTKRKSTGSLKRRRRKWRRKRRCPLTKGAPTTKGKKLALE